MRKRIAAAVFLVASLWITNALASPSLGQLTVDGKSITLTHAYAVSGPDTFDGTQRAYLVLLTEKALAPDAIKKAESFAELGGKSVRSLLESGLAVEISPDKGYHLTVRHPALGGSELQKSGNFGLKVTTLGPDRVVGTVASSAGMTPEGDGGPEEITPSHRVQFKIHFDVPVERQFALEEKLELAKNATKLPAGGGEPGKVWLKECKPAPKLPDLKDPRAIEKFLFAQGMTEKDVQEQMAQMSKKEGRKVTRDEALKSMGDFMKGMAELGSALTPQNCKVLGGAQDGKVAILQVEATLAGEKQRTDITLKKEDGAWAVKKTGAWHSP